MSVTDVLAAVLILLGVSLSVIAGIGLHRFPDVFARMHAASKPATLGLALTLLGAALRMPDPQDVVKLVLALVLQLITVPIGAHMLGRAAYASGSELSPDTTVDELAPVLAAERAAQAAAPDPEPEETP